MNCLNCDEPTAGNYCANCGQKTSVGRLTIRETISHFLGAYFSFEGPLWRTTWFMLRRPGVVVRAFIEGKRQKFYKPLPFFIVLTAIYIILRSWLDYDPLKGQVVQVPEGNPEGIKELSSAAAYYMVQHIDQFLFVLVLSIGAIMKLFFWKRYNFAEFLSMSFYITGFYIFIGTFIMLIQHYLEVRHNQFQLILLIGYLAHVMSSTLGSRPWYRWLAYIVCALTSILVYVNVSFVLAYLIVAYR